MTPMMSHTRRCIPVLVPVVGLGHEHDLSSLRRCWHWVAEDAGEHLDCGHDLEQVTRLIVTAFRYWEG